MLWYIGILLILYIIAILRLSEIALLKKNGKRVTIFWSISPFILPTGILISFLLSELFVNFAQNNVYQITIISLVLLQTVQEIVFHIFFKPFRTLKRMKH
jgi:hypothetical protein